MEILTVEREKAEGNRRDGGGVARRRGGLLGKGLAGMRRGASELLKSALSPLYQRTALKPNHSGTQRAARPELHKCETEREKLFEVTSCFNAEEKPRPQMSSSDGEVSENETNTQRRRLIESEFKGGFGAGVLSYSAGPPSCGGRSSERSRGLGGRRRQEAEPEPEPSPSPRSNYCYIRSNIRKDGFNSRQRCGRKTCHKYSMSSQLMFSASNSPEKFSSAENSSLARSSFSSETHSSSSSSRPSSRGPEGTRTRA
ncbi:hypothetical protein EYF80_025182 [Liparis tanakae]|uniref:Uncharacterized protein n=1 Tax=Liparis tanakae TaxID=230148 RepID=A0A4Z2HH22_9TELE|nr:hypothetical protein EYF80_025182 [Liparis tanakae]